MSDIHKKTLAAINAHGMFEDARAVVIGLSGGPDSVALLHLLVELRPDHFPEVELHAAHLHHGMRGKEADSDARFCAALAGRLGLPFTEGREDVPLRARMRRQNEEAAGREARYDFLREVARRIGANRIATGHQSDDQAETILMRIRRGAGPRGLAGIPYSRPDTADPSIRIIRPLLDCSREEVEEFLRHRNITARLDRTNRSSEYLRNRVRHAILPALQRTWPGPLKSHLLSLARAAGLLHTCAVGAARAVSQSHPPVIEPGYVETNAAFLRHASAELVPHLIRHWMEAAGLWRRPLDRAHYDRLRALLERDDGEVTLPGRVLASVSRDSLILCDAPTRNPNSFRVPLRIPGETAVAPIRSRVHTELLQATAADFTALIAAKDPCEEFLDADKLQPPLLLRFPLPGDRMRPLGAPGKRKIYDILADLHVPRRRRPRTLILTAAETPVWIAGHRIAHSARLTPRTRNILHLRLIKDG